MKTERSHLWNYSNTDWAFKCIFEKTLFFISMTGVIACMHMHMRWPHRKKFTLSLLHKYQMK